MTTQCSFYKMCSMMGNYRTFLLGRPAIYFQQSAGVKQSLEKKAGIPEKPKRPMTPYFRYMADVRPTIMKNNPDAKITDIAKVIGSQWEKLNPANKQQLSVAYQKEKEVYLQALEKYNSKLSEEDRLKLKDTKKQIEERREKSKLKMRIKELGKPKKPPTAYLYFANEKLAQRGGTDIVEWRKKTSEQWSALSEKDKEVYVKRQKTAQETYKRDLNKWEERMIRMGNIELVRNEVLIERGPSSKNKKAGPRGN
ncbi:hypothetical protein B566_EDAN003751 [Ephemera danica]|nr:hypothetical protein B566_EDAN003751 [Ephemera danica]